LTSVRFFVIEVFNMVADEVETDLIGIEDGERIGGGISRDATVVYMMARDPGVRRDALAVKVVGLALQNPTTEDRRARFSDVCNWRVGRFRSLALG
jgi:hypothetical protein